MIALIKQLQMHQHTVTLSNWDIIIISGNRSPSFDKQYISIYIAKVIPTLYTTHVRAATVDCLIFAYSSILADSWLYIFGWGDRFSLVPCFALPLPIESLSVGLIWCNQRNNSKKRSENLSVSIIVVCVVQCALAATPADTRRRSKTRWRLAGLVAILNHHHHHRHRHHHHHHRLDMTLAVAEVLSTKKPNQSETRQNYWHESIFTVGNHIRLLSICLRQFWVLSWTETYTREGSLRCGMWDFGVWNICVCGVCGVF